MYIFLIVLIAIIAVLMTIVVLLQSGKGGGLAGIAAGGATTQLLGTRQAPDILEKATWWLATMFIILCIVTTFFKPGANEFQVIEPPAQSQTIPGTGTAPATGTPPATGDQGTTNDTPPNTTPDE